MKKMKKKWNAKKTQRKCKMQKNWNAKKMQKNAKNSQKNSKGYMPKKPKEGLIHSPLPPTQRKIQEKKEIVQLPQNPFLTLLI